MFFGVDNTFLSRALDAGVFAKYAPSALSTVPDEYQLDASHRLTPVDHGDVCINYDKQWFADKKVAVPKTLDDLTKPAYKGLLVVENPATSSPGLAFQLATIAKYGDDGWRDYWSKLRSNDVKVDDGWESAYDGDFTQGANQGTYPLVVSYASSPPAAVYYSKPQPKTSPIGTMLDSCFRQVEFAGVLKGTEHQAAARKLVDFMLSERVPGRHPAADVRVPGARRHARCPRCSRSSRRWRRSRCRCRPPRSARTVTRGSSSGPTPCCGERQHDLPRAAARRCACWWSWCRSRSSRCSSCTPSSRSSGAASHRTGRLDLDPLA